MINSTKAIYKMSQTLSSLDYGKDLKDNLKFFTEAENSLIEAIDESNDNNFNAMFTIFIKAYEKSENKRNEEITKQFFISAAAISALALRLDRIDIVAIVVASKACVANRILDPWFSEIISGDNREIPNVIKSRILSNENLRFDQNGNNESVPVSINEITLDSIAQFDFISSVVTKKDKARKSLGLLMFFEGDIFQILKPTIDSLIESSSYFEMSTDEMMASIEETIEAMKPLMKNSPELRPSQDGFKALCRYFDDLKFKKSE